MSLFVINPLGIIFKLLFTHKAKTFCLLGIFEKDEMFIISSVVFPK